MTETRGLVAEAATNVEAPIDEVWEAFVDAELIRQYMFGTEVVTDWTEGGRILWKGVWQGARYEDKGTILRVDQPHRLSFSHFSPLTGEADVPGNYHTVTIELAERGPVTQVTLTQDNNQDEEARKHSTRNWEMMLESLKALVEAGSTGR